MTKTMTKTASSPGGKFTYHLQTPIAKTSKKHFIAPLYITVGSRDRAKLFADNFLPNHKLKQNKGRGLLVYTGQYRGLPFSIVTSLMGPAQMEITQVETIISGGRIGCRVGSCGLTIAGSLPGEPIIVKGAMRFDGQTVIAPIEYPAFADPYITTALLDTAKLIVKGKYHAGTEATGNTFYFGQGRLDLLGRMSPQAAYQYELIKFYCQCMSMEAATMFVIASIYGLPAGAINVGYGNRLTDQWLTNDDQKHSAELEAGKIAFEALYAVCDHPAMEQFMTGDHVLSVESVAKVNTMVGLST